MIIRRLQYVWKHARDIAVTCTESTIKYSIPLYSEKTILGKLLEVKQVNGSLHLTFDNSLRVTLPLLINDNSLGASSPVTPSDLITSVNSDK